MSKMTTKPDVFIGCECAFDDAEIVMFSAPFDSTTSFRPGARFAGEAIRRGSYGIETYSPYQGNDIESMRILDAGELELPFGNAEKSLEQIRLYTAQILGAKASYQNIKKPFLIGGEHLVTLGAISAVMEKYSDLHVVHFDAHADLRDEYLGEKLSHATVMRRVQELLGNGKIYQSGIRSGEKDEFLFAEKHTIMHKFDLAKMPDVVRELEGKPVYFSLDLDVLDPSVFPGTGTPEPGGVSFKELHEAILMLKKLNIVACDVVELSPHYDHSGISTMAACKIIREILMAIGG
ncbi:MAG: agmatinase [Defluviitaleaceae bacterium]|nr:agmatinase [Defluviitaleaceae bacterium]